MLWSLLNWLDASPTRYSCAAWTVFAVVAVSALAVFFPIRRFVWWRHPALFAGLLLLCLVAFRWPILFDNQQLVDPDESQMMAGAMTLRHDPLFWRSVDGTTHGPLAQWALVVPLLVGGVMDYTLARTVSVLLIWVSLLGAWMVLRHLFAEGPARLLVLPLLATHAFTNFWGFVQYGSEHTPAALLAIGCSFMIVAWDRSGRAPRPWCLFAAGLALGAVPWAKIQAFPPAAWVAVAGLALIFTTPDLERRQRVRALSALTLGGLAVSGFVLLWIAVNGLWPDFWKSYILNNLQYAGGRWFTWAQTPGKFVELGNIAAGFNPFFLWVVGFSFCGSLLLPWFERWHRRCVLVAWGLLLVALYAVMAPGRMFMHYLQLVLYPAGLLGGLVAGGALAALDRLPPGRVAPRLTRVGLLAVCLACGLAPQIWWRAHESQPVPGHFARTGGRRVHSEVGREIRRHARQGERLGMWGWMPSF
jgi:hypothetical protein